MIGDLFMRKPYFESKERQGKLEKAIDAWEGTPFHHYSSVLGVGVDCNHYVLNVYRLAGLDIKVTFPIYSADRHLHVAQEVLLGYVEKVECLTMVDISNPMNGDLLLYKFGKATSHPAIYFDGYICHSVIKIGVHKMNFKEKKYLKRLTHIYRPMEI